jgi:hypothetical protein
MRSYVMQSQLNVYRDYLPSTRQMAVIFGALLVLTLVPSISTTIFGQSDEANAITDQTISIVNGVTTTDEKPADETPAATEEPTTTEEPADETPTADATDTKDETPATETPEPTPSTDSGLPTTGPAETLSATIGIIAIALGYRHFMRSRAALSRSIKNS